MDKDTKRKINLINRFTNEGYTPIQISWLAEIPHTTVNKIIDKYNLPKNRKKTKEILNRVYKKSPWDPITEDKVLVKLHNNSVPTDIISKKMQRKPSQITKRLRELKLNISRPWDNTDDVLLKELLCEQNMLPNAIAKIMRRSPTKIRDKIIEMDLEIVYKTRKKLNLQTIKEHIVKGLTLEEIGEKYGCTTRAVAAFLYRSGVNTHNVRKDFLIDMLIKDSYFDEICVAMDLDSNQLKNRLKNIYFNSLKELLLSFPDLKKDMAFTDIQYLNPINKFVLIFETNRDAISKNDLLLLQNTTDNRVLSSAITKFLVV